MKVGQLRSKLPKIRLEALPNSLRWRGGTRSRRTKDSHPGNEARGASRQTRWRKAPRLSPRKNPDLSGAPRVKSMRGDATAATRISLLNAIDVSATCAIGSPLAQRESTFCIP